MKKIYLCILFAIAANYANAQKPVVYQQMAPKLNSKQIEGLITEVYTTQRSGIKFHWFKIGSNTLIHVWDRDIDTVRMKVGNKTVFKSLKRLQGNLWRKEKSEQFVLPKTN